MGNFDTETAAGIRPVVSLWRGVPHTSSWTNDAVGTHIGDCCSERISC